jgi:hypothetical protein
MTIRYRTSDIGQHFTTVHTVVLNLASLFTVVLKHSLLVFNCTNSVNVSVIVCVTVCDWRSPISFFCFQYLCSRFPT